MRRARVGATGSVRGAAGIAAVAIVTTVAATSAPVTAAESAGVPLRMASGAGTPRQAAQALARYGRTPGLPATRATGPARGVSTRRAVLASLLVPGLGDWLIGRRERATVFMGADLALWTGVVVSRVQGSRREDAYRDWAVRFAGVSSRSHSDDFYAALRKYDSSDDYAADVKLDGRAELWVDNDPDLNGRVLEAYFVEHRVADYEPWRWTSLRHKVQFQEIRTASKNAYRRATYFVAVAAAARVASAIVTWATLRRGAPDASARTRIDVTPPRGVLGASVAIVHRF